MLAIFGAVVLYLVFAGDDIGDHQHKLDCINGDSDACEYQEAKRANDD